MWIDLCMVGEVQDRAHGHVFRRGLVGVESVIDATGVHFVSGGEYLSLDGRYMKHRTYNLARPRGNGLGADN